MTVHDFARAVRVRDLRRVVEREPRDSAAWQAAAAELASMGLTAAPVVRPPPDAVPLTAEAREVKAAAARLRETKDLADRIRRGLYRGPRA